MEEFLTERFTEYNEDNIARIIGVDMDKVITRLTAEEISQVVLAINKLASLEKLQEELQSNANEVFDGIKSFGDAKVKVIVI